MSLVEKSIAEFDRDFTSMNSVDVDARVSAPRDEWRVLRDELVLLLEQIKDVYSLELSVEMHEAIQDRLKKARKS